MILIVAVTTRRSSANTPQRADEWRCNEQAGGKNALIGRSPAPSAPTTCTHGGVIDTRHPQEQSISVRWILRVLRVIPLTPWWARARQRQSRREMREHLRRYYANGQ
jgi:hypothetical protein